MKNKPSVSSDYLALEIKFYRWVGLIMTIGRSIRDGNVDDIFSRSVPYTALYIQNDLISKRTRSQRDYLCRKTKIHGVGQFMNIKVPSRSRRVYYDLLIYNDLVSKQLDIEMTTWLKDKVPFGIKNLPLKVQGRTNFI